jgi:NAD(P)-dependent dehydrogenase (short-subunit alcohol dehydrogenase family)
MLAFARAGAHVVIHHSSSAAEAESAALEARALGVKVLIVKADQSKPAEVEGMFGKIRRSFGKLDILVNSAASFKKGDLIDLDFDDWQAVIATNLSGPFLCSQQAARLMREAKQGGVIINISDNSGLNPWVARPHHSIAKAGVIMLTQVAALSFAPYQIRVNCVVPGPVLVAAGEPAQSIKVVAQGLPLKRIGEPDDIARACVFLAQSDFATGSIWRLDGGEGLVGAET